MGEESNNPVADAASSKSTGALSRGRAALQRYSALIFCALSVAFYVEFEGWASEWGIFHGLFQVLALLILLIFGPWHYVWTGIKILLAAVWIPLKLTLGGMVNNWEAFVVFFVEFATALARQKWSVFLMCLGGVFASLAIEHGDPLSGYAAVFLALVLVLYRFIEQYAGHLGWNDVLDKIAGAVEEQGPKPTSKPKLKKERLLNEHIDDDELGKVLNQLLSYWLIESILAKIKRQYLKITFHIIAVLSLCYSVIVIFIAAGIAASGVYAISKQVAGGTTLLSVWTSLLSHSVLLEKSTLPGVSGIAALFRALVALQVLFFARTIFETTKAAVDQFLRRLEKGLTEIRARKSREIEFTFGRTPDELAAAVKRRGDHLGKVIDAVRAGRAGEAVKLLEKPKKKGSADAVKIYDQANSGTSSPHKP